MVYIPGTYIRCVRSTPSSIYLYGVCYLKREMRRPVEIGSERFEIGCSDFSLLHFLPIVIGSGFACALYTHQCFPTPWLPSPGGIKSKALSPTCRCYPSQLRPPTSFTRLKLVIASQKIRNQSSIRTSRRAASSRIINHQWKWAARTWSSLYPEYVCIYVGEKMRVTCVRQSGARSFFICRGF